MAWGALGWNMTVNRRLFATSLLAASVAGCSGPPDYVEFTPEKRKRLVALRKADKFLPEESEVRSYSGPADDQAKSDLNKIMNDMVDAILVQPNGRLDGSIIRELFLDAIKKLDKYSPDDGHRGIDYMVDIWRILGFKTKSGILGEAADKNGNIMSFGWILDQIMGAFGGGGSAKH